MKMPPEDAFHYLTESRGPADINTLPLVQNRRRACYM